VRAATGRKNATYSIAIIPLYIRARVIFII